MMRYFGRAAILSALLAGASLPLVACSGPRPAEAPSSAAPARGPAPRYAFEALDGRPITPEAMAGRLTVIGFFTTYDVPSQVQARYLAMLERHHTPRLNVAVLMLEAPENRPLIEAFAASLGLTYPIAIADAATIAGEGPFAGLHHVPSVVILDRQGREAWRHAGVLDEKALDTALAAIEKADGIAPAK
jgi:hypothetical protein